MTLDLLACPVSQPILMGPLWRGANNLIYNEEEHFWCLSNAYQYTHARISRRLLPNQQNSFPLLNGSRVLNEPCWASMVEAFHPCEKMRIQYARDSLFEVNINASVISHMQNCSISKSTADYPVADRINCTLISSWNLTDPMVVSVLQQCANEEAKGTAETANAPSHI